MGPVQGRLYESCYRITQRRLSRSLHPTASTAVVIHLYHLDTWALFARGLTRLRDVDVDLFITIPRRQRRFAETIRAGFPDAHVVTVPNRGRGTLPFVKIAQVLERHRYEVVLKLHCKKQTPVVGVRSFLDVVVDSLLPESFGAVEQVIEHLLSCDAAVLGPSDTYLPLDVSLAANRERIASLLGEFSGQDLARRVLGDPSAYGFFAGTMFWARLDAIEPLLRFRAYDFEPELGQRDGTLAHALEQMFTLLPALQGRRLLESTGNEVRSRALASDNPPWWFEARQRLEETGT